VRAIGDASSACLLPHRASAVGVGTYGQTDQGNTTASPTNLKQNELPA